MSDPRILVVNFGATSSKLALFSGDICEIEDNLQLDQELAKRPLAEQHEVRLEHVREFVKKAGFASAEIAAVAARGGLAKPLSSGGVYRVDSGLLADLTEEKYGSHPSNLSSIIAQAWADEVGGEIPVYIVDPVSTDTLWDVARISGVPEVERQGRHHALNVQRAAREAARRLDLPLFKCRLVVGHFGSGVSICSMYGQRVVDVNDAQLGEGPFAVARAGTLPIRGVLDLAYGEPDRKKLERKLASSGGLSAYTGTADFIEVEKMLDAGDAKAVQAYEAMVFQSAKYLAAAAGALGEQPDAIVLTGGLLKSERFASDLTERIEWLGAVEVIPGEDEMAALAEGVAQALAGFEPTLNYSETEVAADAPPRSFEEVTRRAAHSSGCNFVVAGGNHPEIAETVKLCHEYGIHGFTLVGPADEIKAQLETEQVSCDDVTVVDSADVITDAIAQVQGQPHSVLVKGKCNTAGLLKAVLGCLPEGSKHFLSHVAVIENPFAGKLLLVSDGGLNLDPDMDKKIGIMENGIACAHALGARRPRVLLAAGMEDKGQDVPAIADAREIVNRHKAGEWADAVIDGPFGLDVAISAQAAMSKGIKTPVAGITDVVVTPNLESCNFAVKMVNFYSSEPWGGVVIGGPFPVVVGSRSDEAESRLCSIALAQLVAAGMAG